MRGRGSRRSSGASGTLSSYRGGRWGVVGWLWGWDEVSGRLRDEVSGGLRDEVSGSLRDELSEGLWDELSGALRDDLSGDRQVLLESSRERPVRHPRGSRRDLGS